MNAYRLMTAIYALLEREKPDSLKKVFHPGKPAGPFSQNLPAVTICTGDPAESRSYPSDDVVAKDICTEVHVWTRDPYEKMEVRSRGTYEALWPLLLELASTLEGDPTLSGLVDDLEDLEIYDTSPGHGWIRATYTTQEGRM